MFNTPEADRILATLEVFPTGNPWKEDISKRPVDRNSRNMIASVGAEKNLAYNLDMGFILVPPDQKRVPVSVTAYPDESDPGPFPVPDDAPIEGWPVVVPSLDTIQRVGNGDRHMLIVDPVNMTLFEFYQARKKPGLDGRAASIFDLKSNRLRGRVDLDRCRRPAHFPIRGPL